MSMLDSKPHSPRYYGLVIPTLALLIAAVVGLTGYVYGQSSKTDRIDRTAKRLDHTQHQVCQAFMFFAERTQQQIDLTAARLKADQASGNRKSIALDRKSISDATSFLIRIKRVQC